MKRKTNRQSANKIQQHIKYKNEISTLYMWCEDIECCITEQYDPESEGEDISDDLYCSDGWDDIHQGMADIERITCGAYKQRRYLTSKDYDDALRIWDWIFKLTFEFHGFMQDHWKRMNMVSLPLSYGYQI